MKVVTSHFLEHSHAALPETKIFLTRNVWNRKPNKNELFLGYLRRNQPPPGNCRKFQACNNVEPDEDILFVKTKTFTLREERSTQSPVVLRRALPITTNKPTWLSKPKESLIGLNKKPDIQTNTGI